MDMLCRRIRLFPQKKKMNRLRRLASSFSVIKMSFVFTAVLLVIQDPRSFALHLKVLYRRWRP